MTRKRMVRRLPAAKRKLTDRALVQHLDRMLDIQQSLETTQSQLRRLPIPEDVWLDEGDPLHVETVPDVRDDARNRSWCSHDFYWFGYARVADAWCLAVKINRGTWIRQDGDWAYFLTAQIGIKPISDCNSKIQTAAERSLSELFRQLEWNHGTPIPNSWQTVPRDIVRRLA